MSVSAVTSNMASVYGTEYSTSAKKAETEKKEETAGAVYETSEKKEEKATYSINKMSAADRASLVSQLKADAEARQSQFVSMVQKMMSEQTNAYGQANDIWSFLASGKFTVDPATKLQAQQDIVEDGYYGVEQTASRIFDFASALAGDDEEAMKKCRQLLKRALHRLKRPGAASFPTFPIRPRMLSARSLKTIISPKALPKRKNKYFGEPTGFSVIEE